MTPRIVRKPPFQVVGMAGRFTPSTTSRIPELWAKFSLRMDAVPQRRNLHTFGVCIPNDASPADEGEFQYVAGVEVDGVADVPEGMVAIPLPACSYAVFTHTGHVSRIGDTVRYVWGQWLPTAPYRHRPVPDFELYDPERWSAATGEGEVDLYVPIVDG